MPDTCYKLVVSVFPSTTVNMTESESSVHGIRNLKPASCIRSSTQPGKKKREQTMNWCILVLLFAANFVRAQKGFLNIACGWKSNFTDDRGLVWVPDTNYIKLGQAQRVSETMSPYFVYMQNLRKFPKPLNKSCYGIPWSSTHPFLLRLSFYNKENWPGLFNYSVETTEMLYESDKLNGEYYEYEGILRTMGTTVYICLNRMSEAADPFISAIQMIEFKDGMYKWAKPKFMLKMLARYDIGGETGAIVRYPNDTFDRIWYAMTLAPTDTLISTSLEIDANSTAEVPPSAVMQTAEMIDSSTPVVAGPFDQRMKVLVLLYFSKINKSSERVSFGVSNDNTGEVYAANVTLVRNYIAKEIPIPPEIPSQKYEIRLQRLDGKSKVPLNALEIYVFANTKQGTAREDVEALNDLKNTQTSNSLTKYWVSDPCFIVPWRYISCTRDRVSHLYLSGKNFSGYLPQTLGNLTALVYLDLSNNSFEGPLPDLSNLTLLEAIDVSNNKLNDTLESLVKLTRLRKVFVQNNNFSGEIPRELEKLGARNFSYSGNPYLHNSTTKTKNHAVIIGATIGGVLLLLIVITILIIFYPRKKPIVKFMDQKPSSSVVIPHSSKCRSFSMEEMRLATQDFSQEIGRGGFGFVYYGQLPEGVEIAVKVLSVFSHQGTDEFLNEVVILSGLNHTSLVKLLGFCSDADELMLVYEYMPLGSLKDHLSGSKKATVDLSWKDRLQIAIDAACGLEYLHLECNPRIVHRDLKSANILLDHNLNGKLSDLGLSRVFKDEDTHVTTTVKGTAGYLDPEYFNMHVLTEKSDVYSLGVVLLELVCGRAPIDQKLGEDQINLVRWVKPYVEREDPEELKLVMDWRLKGRFGTMRSIAIVSRLAMRCLEMEPSARPDAREVVEILREAMEIETEARAEAESLHSSAPKDGDSATGSSYSHNVDSGGSSDNYGINRTPASS